MLGDMTFSSAQRNQLAHLFLELGPNAPTLCEGWETKDLAAHLWIRENRLDAAGGMFIPQLEARLEDLTEQTLDRDFEDVVNSWAAGPPRWLKPFDAQMNAMEYLIPHEDRRVDNATTAPQPLSQAAQKPLYSPLTTVAPLSVLRAAMLLREEYSCFCAP